MTLLPVSELLPSIHGNESLYWDIAMLFSKIWETHNTDYTLPLLKSIINREPDEQIWDRVYDAVEGLSWRDGHSSIGAACYR
jgi:hypothetical protein